MIYILCFLFLIEAYIQIAQASPLEQSGVVLDTALIAILDVVFKPPFIVGIIGGAVKSFYSSDSTWRISLIETFIGGVFTTVMAPILDAHTPATGRLFLYFACGYCGIELFRACIRYIKNFLEKNADGILGRLLDRILGGRNEHRD